MKTIRDKYVNNPYFDPNLVKKVSTACEGLCKWVRAIEVYDRVIKIVSPKKAKLAEAETELARQMDKLNEKRSQLVKKFLFNRRLLTFANFFLIATSYGQTTSPQR